MSPTARTLAHLRRQGFLAAVVEVYLPWVKRKRDLFGVGDVLAVHPVDGVFLLVQSTTAAHLPDRLARVKARPELATWLKAGGRFEVHGWHRRPAGWRLRRTVVSLDDLAGIVAVLPRRRRPDRQRSLFEGIAWTS